MPKNRNGEDVVVPPKDDEELYLEKLVFGDADGFEKNLKKTDNLFDYSSDEEDDGSSDKFFHDASSNSSEDEDDLENVQDDDLFFIDDGQKQSENEDEDEDMDVDVQYDEEEEDVSDEEANAWEDSDDEKLNVSLIASDKLKKLRKTTHDTSISGRSYIVRLRNQFEKIYPRPEWIEALESDHQDENEDDSDIEIDREDDEPSGVADNDTNSVLKILSSTQQFVITKQLKLISPNKVSITRLKDANYQKISKSAIQSLSFHHSHPLLMTGGFDRTIRIYHIDGKINSLVTSLHLRNSPISVCHFSPLGANTKDGDKNLVYAAGRRRYMNKWDLNSGEVEKISRMYGHEQHQKSFEYFKISPKGTFIGLTGNSGWCNILNGATGQWVKGFKIEGTIVDFEFSKDESFIVIINTAGEVWEYELTAQDAVLRRWQDDGGIGITKIKLGGPKNRWLAIGTNNGFVNIYDRNTFTESTKRKPFKTVENLVTSISSLAFSPDGQILCIASRAKRDAMRLVHLPSGSVYSNWPTSGTPLGKVTAVAFSPNNEMLAVGNEAGKVTLWRLNHY
ncbi:U3 snoRNA associated protein [Scheffersomyces stipitis CBS 6054]|uniref:U3 snoRNA associated protein n=1 Tax=Scheffersomyces stipitis (strain ATCC 58785 / CBS 6054 / NBRC 10063 / NRRL Y-11545) TaxID=322104 RepID=A3LWK2_PICST|nr:U3 snoRNA associated protein [Scheffersomyces stipitis CBS 6054]ABN67294.1 U3 snoRNA associated protein [Scheffersomyces stipitis CBS 6054]